MEGDIAILVAAGQGDVDEVRRMLVRRPELANAEMYTSALHEASTAEVAALLLRYGANVNARNNDGNTPLHLARNESVARILVEAGANVEMAALNRAVGDDRVDVARYLISLGLRVTGNTSLIGAVSSIPMAELLLENGCVADLGPEDGGGNLLRRAAGNGNTPIVELFLRFGADVNLEHPRLGTPLVSALKYGGLDTVKALLDGGANVKIGVDYHGNTPLHLVAERGLYERDLAVANSVSAESIAAQMIALGADPRTRNLEGEMPIHVARRNGTAGMISLLNRALSTLSDPYLPSPGPPQSTRIRMHPRRPEAVTTVRGGALARWSLNGNCDLICRVQTQYADLQCLSVSADGSRIAIAYQNVVEVRRWDDLKLVSRSTLAEGEQCQYVDFVADGRTIAVAMMRRVEFENQTPPKRYSRGAFMVELSAPGQPMSGEYLVPSILLVNVATGRVVRHFEDQGRTTWLASLCNGRSILCGGMEKGGSQNGRLALYRLRSFGRNLQRIWCDDCEKPSRYEADAGGEELDFDADVNRLPECVVEGAVNSTASLVAFFCTDEFPRMGTLGEVVVQSIATGRLLWRRTLDTETLGDQIDAEGNYSGPDNVDVFFWSDNELVVGTPRRSILFFDIKSGALNRRLAIDTPEHGVSLAPDRANAVIWVVLRNGDIISVAVD